MSKKDKLLARLQQKPKDFTWDELKTLMAGYDYKIFKNGKTSGSRRLFESENSDLMLRLHEPHPQNILKSYQVEEVLDFLIAINVIKKE
jgi:hypothetical protein